jgi:hypothetical protein
MAKINTTKLELEMPFSDVLNLVAAAQHLADVRNADEDVKAALRTILRRAYPPC